MNEGHDLVIGLLIFVVTGILMSATILIIGKLLRTNLPHPEKDEAYECGEPAIGDSWVQFDLRFYVVALVFLIFDIEVALFFPGAVVYKEAGIAALWDMLFFFAVLVVGFLYLWRFGYLDWVRATEGQMKRERTVRSDDALGRAAREWI